MSVCDITRVTDRNFVESYTEVFYSESLKNKPLESVCSLFLPGFLLGLIFDRQDGGNKFLRNVCELYQTTRRYDR
jgi:hypothetical protein